MKARLTPKGELFLMPENGTEEYAINRWLEDWGGPKQGVIGLDPEANPLPPGLFAYGGPICKNINPAHN